MKKKLVMRKWFENLILVIGSLAFLIVASECDSLLVLIVSHLIAIIILAFVGYMLTFYGRETKEDA